MSWRQVAPVKDIPLREGRRLLVGRREIAVFNLGDRFFAVDNSCPHRGGPLCDGIVAGNAVVCPLHAWKVNLESGEIERPANAAASCVRVHPTRIERGILVIDVSDVPGPCPSDHDRQPSTCAEVQP